MTSAEVHAAIAIVLGLAIAYPALALLLRALAPDAVGAAERQVRERPVRSLLAGVAVTGPVLVAVVVLGQAPGAGKAASAILFTGLFLYAYAGVAGLCGHVGARLSSPADAARPWLPTLRGALVLECACGLPVFGWFFLAPAALVAGAGALTIGLCSRAPALEPAPGLEPAPALEPGAPLAPVSVT